MEDIKGKISEGIKKDLITLILVGLTEGFLFPLFLGLLDCPLNQAISIKLKTL